VPATLLTVGLMVCAASTNTFAAPPAHRIDITPPPTATQAQGNNDAYIYAHDPEPDKKKAAADLSASTKVTATLGPPGYAYDPTTGQIKATDAKNQKKYVAISFMISSSPVLAAVVHPDNMHQAEKVYNTKQDLQLLDVDIDLIPYDKDHSKMDCNSIKVLALLPSQTQAATEDTALGKAATVAGGVGDILAGTAATATAAATGGLNPGSSLGSKIKTTSGSLSVIFNNLFPPRSVPTQYAFQTSSHAFGWFFRRYTRQSASTSILGLHPGLVLLEVDKDVDFIGVQWDALSHWDKPVQSTGHSSNWYHDGNTHYEEKTPGKQPVLTPPDICLELPHVPTNTEIIQSLKNLDDFPMLIPQYVPEAGADGQSKRVDVVHILQLKDEAELKTLIANSLQGHTPLEAVGDCITKSSLEIYLGLKEPPSAKSSADNQKPAP